MGARQGGSSVNESEEKQPGVCVGCVAD
jgi:hypothetical protein